MTYLKVMNESALEIDCVGFNKSFIQELIPHSLLLILWVHSIACIIF